MVAQNRARVHGVGKNFSRPELGTPPNRQASRDSWRLRDRPGREAIQVDVPANFVGMFSTDEQPARGFCAQNGGALFALFGPMTGLFFAQIANAGCRARPERTIVTSDCSSPSTSSPPVHPFVRHPGRHRWRHFGASIIRLSRFPGVHMLTGMRGRVLLLALLGFAGCGGGTLGNAEDAKGASCRWPASLDPRDASDGQCTATRAYLECPLSDGTTLLCTSDDPTRCPGVSSACQNQCTASEYAVSCGTVGPSDTPYPEPPAGCRLLGFIPAGIGFYCCPCGS